MLNLLVEQPAAVTYHLHLPSLPTDYVNKPIKTFKSAKPRPLSHKNKEIINRKVSFFILILLFFLSEFGTL